VVFVDTFDDDDVVVVVLHSGGTCSTDSIPSSVLPFLTWVGGGLFYLPVFYRSVHVLPHVTYLPPPVHDYLPFHRRSTCVLVQVHVGWSTCGVLRLRCSPPPRCSLPPATTLLRFVLVISRSFLVLPGSWVRSATCLHRSTVLLPFCVRYHRSFVPACHHHLRCHCSTCCLPATVYHHLSFHRFVVSFCHRSAVLPLPLRCSTVDVVVVVLHTFVTFVLPDLHLRLRSTFYLPAILPFCSPFVLLLQVFYHRLRSDSRFCSFIVTLFGHLLLHLLLMEYRCSFHSVLFCSTVTTILIPFYHSSYRYCSIPPAVLFYHSIYSIYDVRSTVVWVICSVVRLLLLIRLLFPVHSLRFVPHSGLFLWSRYEFRCSVLRSLLFCCSLRCWSFTFYLPTVLPTLHICSFVLCSAVVTLFYVTFVGFVTTTLRFTIPAPYHHRFVAIPFLRSSACHHHVSRCCSLRCSG